MTIIEGIGDEVTHVFVALFAIIIGTIAWWTTNISEQRYVSTVVVLERRRFRAQRIRLINHTESASFTEGSNALTPIEDEPTTTEVSTETRTVLDEVLNENNPRTSSENLNPENILSQEVQDEEQSIIETMDTDANIVRQRRLAFYSGFTSDLQDPSNTHSTFSNSNNLATETSNASSQEPKPSAPPSEERARQENADVDNSTGITIKLKYINDDLKLVKGNLNESLGEFKKRHFVPELAANKLIRLIFNGQVLQPDTQTLKNCGLFDNCVVHCLIHQKRTQPNDPNVTESRREGYSFPNQGVSATNNNNQNRDLDLGNFLFAFISFILLAAWYFRYVYAHLYTVTATVGLILITGVFTIVLVGMYFPDNEQHQIPTFRIRERTTRQLE